MRGAVRQVEWVGDDDPERVEAATITLAADRLDALGTSRSTDYVTSWSLETGPDWVTSRLDVAVFGRGFTRRLALARDAHGRWTSEATQEGVGVYHDEELADPGIDARDAADGAFDGALDCDLALCPVTNTMPILRLGANRHEVAETRFVMAWVALPSLAVSRSEQLYSATPYDEEAGHAVVRYSSESRDFTADLTVDPDGIVIDYPQLARRIRTRARP
ncbi:putative glycolipid-binding domain-containing protein [Leifsonia sp. PS1209]|uniref:putative glycolipid-binding domain-containing protein n=1 Tax=Leifsonia sp. PS1209 TaxID=2724914 RepID=UPI001442BC66|nr:putative glycolipid-binding domain-containing protein [Leifsonia sp. PS1209]QIZ99135.1 putative glycolipid-binding domain-containing protein [Leifsonia sp. PS1209]